MSLAINMKRLPHGEGLEVPQAMTTGAVGMDLLAAVEAPLSIAPRQRALVPTGLVLEIPEGFEGQVRPRSGLALKFGITVLNAPGTIDADYRGEVGVLLINHGDTTFEVTRGMRIAQLIVAPCTKARLVESHSLSQTARGHGGYGSTGLAT